MAGTEGLESIGIRPGLGGGKHIFCTPPPPPPPPLKVSTGTTAM